MSDDPKEPPPQASAPMAFWSTRGKKIRVIPRKEVGILIGEDGRPSEKTTLSEDGAAAHKMQATSERSFNVALAAYGAMFGTGLLQLAAHDWYFGPIFTLGGGLGLMSIHPFIRPKLQATRSPRALLAMVTMTWLFLAANIGFSLYDHFWLKAASPTIGTTSPERWPALTPTQAEALASRVRFIPPEDIVVACETLNCRDLADGIADILQKTPGWNVSILHRGGFDITGVTGIQLNPNEPASGALRDALESTGLAVKLGPDTRKDLGSDKRTFLTVGTRPF